MIPQPLSQGTLFPRTLVPFLIPTLIAREARPMEGKRPIGALGVVAILTIFILTFWFVTFGVFLARG